MQFAGRVRIDCVLHVHHDQAEGEKVRTDVGKVRDELPRKLRPGELDEGVMRLFPQGINPLRFADFPSKKCDLRDARRITRRRYG